MLSSFPKNFLWGASISSHQVEGENNNDWSEWEKSPARLKDLEKTGLTKKFGIKNFISGKSADHYNRYKEDFALAQELGHNATRFSIEWSRIEPEEGKFDKKEIAHYVDMVKTCRKLGLEPFVTLWHWTIPIWLRDKGGVLATDFPKLFGRYTERVVKEIPEVKFWITINEPEIFSMNSYIKGVWPPNKRNPILYSDSLRNLAEAHRIAYEKIKNVRPESQIGIAKNNIYFESAGGPINFILKKIADSFWNFDFLNRIKLHQDFIGLNHYFHNRINYWFNRNKNEKTSDMGWELYPEAIYHCLVDLKKYDKPIYITENGLADTKDEKREWFIKETLKQINKAVSEGVDVRGYLHWSLLDNFEWDKGFWPRFGLIEIDYGTLQRKPRKSAFTYKKIIEESSVS